MSRFRHALAERDNHILTLQAVIVLLCLCLAGVGYGWYRAPQKLTLWFPPDLRSGSTRPWWEVPPASVYAFTFYIFQQLNRWPDNGEEDYLHNLRSLRAYLTPACYTRLADPALVQELQDFVNDCYGPSRTRLKRLGSDISEEQSREVDWVGSSFYLSTPGYYDHDHSHTPRAAWPYDASRDDGLNDTGGGGYPACKEWWSDGDAGLKDRLLKQVDTSLWQQLQKLGQSKEEYEEAVLRSLVSPRNMQVSQGGLVYNGFGGNAGDNLSQTQLLSRVGGIIGAGLSSYALFPAFDNVRQALPMVQAFLEMALVICIPVILLFSAWDLKTVITLSFVQFALFFLTFWWELARWLDNWLMQMMYDSDTHSYFNLWGLQNTSDDLIVNIIMGVMFLVLPAFWLGALTWAGVRIGAAIAGVMGSAVGDIRSAGEQVGKMIVSKTRIP